MLDKDDKGYKAGRFYGKMILHLKQRMVIGNLLFLMVIVSV